MKPRFTCKSLALSMIRAICALSLVASTTAYAAPTEQPAQVLTRTAQSGQIVETTLTKNQFRQEAYQAEYDVQVPYQATETYIESVPYQVQEAYTDYEQTCRQEYRCHDVPHQECGYEQECRMVDGGQSCRQERECRTVGGGQECRQERVCKPTPGQNRCEMVTECGTNAQGQQICKERKVCHQEPGGEDCDYVQRCENKPGREECSYNNVCTNNPDRRECSNEYRCRNTTRSECGHENICSQTPVTKYRTVTKYRDEERTREVTKYRTETRCCVTKYREVFDRQDSLRVIVRFPQGSELLANESEKLKVEFLGDASKPDVSVALLETVLGYKVANKVVQGATATIDLALAPKYSEAEVGEKSVSAVKLMIKPHGSALSLTDAVATKPRLASRYSAVIKAKDSGAVVAQVESLGTQSTNVVLPVAQALSADLDYSIEVTVQRSGVVLAAPVTFVKKAEFLFDRIDASQLGAATIKELKLSDSGKDVLLTFKDLGASNLYETDYKMVLAGVRDGKVVFEKQITAEEILKADKSAQVLIAGNEINDTQDYKLSLSVDRSGRALSAPVEFDVFANYARVLDVKPYTNESLVGNLDIQGAESAAILVLKDAAPAHAAVTKTYRLHLERTAGFLGSKKETILEKVLTADQVKVDAGGIAKLKISSLGVDSETLSKYVRDGKTIFVMVTFIRQSPRLNNGKPVQLVKSTKVKIEK